MRNISIATLKVRRDAKLKLLREAGPLVQGSLYKKRIKCGAPSCRCAKGERHEAYVLTQKVNGKTKTTHVPRDLVDEVKTWANEAKRVKKLMKEISDLNEQIIRMHVKTSRAVAQNQKRAEQTLQKSSKTSSDTTSPSS